MNCLYFLTSHSLPDATRCLCWNCFPQTNVLDIWVFVVVVCLFVCSDRHAWPEFPWWSQSEGTYTEANVDLLSFLLWNLTPEQRHTEEDVSAEHQLASQWKKSTCFFAAQHPRAPIFPALPETWYLSSSWDCELYCMLIAPLFLFKLLKGKWGVKANKHRVSFFP